MSNLQIRFAELPIAAASETFYDLTGYADRLTSLSPNEIGQAKARKALERALKARTPKRWKPPKLNPGVIGASLRGGQELAYAQATGREWSEVDPEPKPRDFGAPEYPDVWVSGNVRCPQALDAYYVAFDAWYETSSRADWDTACSLWESRRAQFRYTGRGSSDANVLAMCADRLPLEVAA